MPVGKLSGGEQARVLLAGLMLQPADVLVLDEPTNDLDIPTLEVLEESLLEFPGAVVLVTHDRYLFERVTTTVLGFDGSGGVARLRRLRAVGEREEGPRGAGAKRRRCVGPRAARRRGGHARTAARDTSRRSSATTSSANGTRWNRGSSRPKKRLAAATARAADPARRVDAPTRWPRATANSTRPRPRWTASTRAGPSSRRSVGAEGLIRRGISSGESVEGCREPHRTRRIAFPRTGARHGPAAGGTASAPAPPAASGRLLDDPRGEGTAGHGSMRTASFGGTVAMAEGRAARGPLIVGLVDQGARRLPPRRPLRRREARAPGSSWPSPAPTGSPRSTTRTTTVATTTSPPSGPRRDAHRRSAPSQHGSATSTSRIRDGRPLREPSALAIAGPAGPLGQKQQQILQPLRAERGRRAGHHARRSPLRERSRPASGMWKPCELPAAQPIPASTSSSLTIPRASPCCSSTASAARRLNFRDLIASLDRKRYQAWVAYYPSGGRPRRTARRLDGPDVRRGFAPSTASRKAAVVAHSMGGLVTRALPARGFRPHRQRRRCARS